MAFLCSCHFRLRSLTTISSGSTFWILIYISFVLSICLGYSALILTHSNNGLMYVLLSQSLASSSFLPWCCLIAFLIAVPKNILKYDILLSTWLSFASISYIRPLNYLFSCSWVLSNPDFQKNAPICWTVYLLIFLLFPETFFIAFLEAAAYFHLTASFPAFSGSFANFFIRINVHMSSRADASIGIMLNFCVVQFVSHSPFGKWFLFCL